MIERNMEKFIGLDVNRAQNDLDNLNDACEGTLVSLNAAFTNLFSSLTLLWGSPNAVMFTNTFIPEINDLLSSFISKKNQILSDANRAAIALASSHGSSMPGKYISGGGRASYNIGADGCKENINGVTGMAKEDVRKTLDIFLSEMKSALSSFSGIPRGIAFYDPYGHLLGTFSEGIHEFVNDFSSIFDNIKNELNRHIEEEVHDITAAKEKAQQELAQG